MPNIIHKKIMVVAFMNSNTKVDIHKPKQNKGDVANLKQQQRNRRKAYEGEAVFINQKDRSHASLLKDVKTKMEINPHRNDAKNTAEDLGTNRDVVVENLRHSFEEIQVPTICTSGKTASVLEEAAEMRIGLRECHLHSKTDFPICFKCKECGHIPAECKGEKYTV
ncbi:hypothetical protein HHI36_005085 [Cryptolaemus montrouzieri]|uniref:CCHC-type domain-containing protein n=1 Tax=Cryptolaemus montrouzieri TaxID=559131 RepID=A0ABD2NTB6_9CUCU